MTGIDLGLMLALAGAIASALTWFRSVVRAGYARERETTHILTAVQQQNVNIQELFTDLADDHRSILKELDEVGDRLQRLELTQGVQR